ncbi:MAG: SDR family NAD(P)-dependent oxidoreductase [Cyclonatronaceae bacterium]
MKRLENKVAIITGAASGMGAAEAKLFAKEGAKVVATDIQEEKLQDIVERIKSEGGEAVAIKQDVTLKDDWDRVVEKAVKRYGQIDILINNAGIGGAEGFAKLDDVDIDSWNKFMNVNSTGNFLGVKAVAPEMKKAGKGSIINTSSIAGLVGGAAGIQYSASKGANRIMSKTAAIELAPHNIRVNSIHPGFIDTPMVSVVTENKEALEASLKLIPMGRTGTPDEIANLVLFLASDESGYITGAEITIDGGFTAQ